MEKWRASKRYKYFIDLFITDKKLFEHWNPSDIVLISELPYPLYNDIILKQYGEYKREKKQIDEKIKDQKIKQQQLRRKAYASRSN